MKVRIAFATKPDGNGGQTIDADRIGTIEDLPDGDAKELVKQGVAAAATEQEIRDYEIDLGRRADAEPLDGLTKAELWRRIPDGADVDDNATKADLIAAVDAARRAIPTTPVDQPIEAPVSEPAADEVDLNALTMEQLREQYPAAAEQPSNAKKADLIAAVEAANQGGTQATGTTQTRRNRISGQLEDVDYADGAPITTVAPGAESSPDVDPADRDK